MTTEHKNLEKHIQKQMGCMAGFLQIFDRHHIITRKRLPPVGDATSDSGKSAPHSPDLGKQTPPPELPPKSPLPLPIFELKDGVRSSWKFRKEAPRLSLDSRATTDAKGSLHPKQIRIAEEHRSPSVIARLMGLDQLPNSSDSNLPELRRSASESRVSRDLFQSRLMAADSTTLYPNSPTPQSLSTHHNNASLNPHYTDPRKQSVKKGDGGVNSVSPWRAPQPHKNFFDVFPEPKQNISIYGEIEKRLRMRGVDEPSKDLETLKHILEALQLKGLLHSKPPQPQPQPQPNHVRHRNFIFDDSPIVLMKPTRPPPSKPSNGRKQVNGVRRNYSLSGETSPSPSPRRERNARSPTRSGRSGSPISRRVEGSVNASRSNSPAKPKRSVNESTPVRSPKINGIGPDRSPRFKKPTVVINQKEKIMTVEDAYSSVSEGTVDTPTDTEGKSLLERCDKLLHNIAEFAAADMQPSPVSVLDPFFDSLTPSPVTTKRNIHFKDHYGESEDEIWSPIVSPICSKRFDSDCDFVYVSDILRASHYLPEVSDVFLLLEKQQHIKGNDTSKVSRLQRKLIFDTITEILAREAWLPPWKAHHSAMTLDKVWSEFQKIRECDTGHEDLFETICGVLKKDLAGDGWGDCQMEGSEVVLDIERMVFKDLVSETIEDLSSSSTMMLRRKLVF
ncbi:hypothetical protein SASPL_111149 [Salvia splendens]|uniref:DUF4378 domain-containing protein n=1 Tax=Salvia splendens TaxID=180675 RepID=A0A8X8Y7I3_SALSN|nr:protein LONGIFOLIA 1-like [Salvia splendens]KAG6426910.1 hypothetical protein SASPL_111149 [Salvia splendens]